MASAPVEVRMPTGMTLTLDLFPYGSDTAAASGKTLTEAANRKGLYTATITEGLSGLHTAHVKLSGNVIAVFGVYMSDDTTVHRCEDSPEYLYKTGWSVLTTADVDARLAAAGVTSAVMARLNSSISACLQAANVPSNFSAMLISTAGGTTLSPTGLDSIAVTDPGAVGNYTTLPHYIVGLWRWFFKKSINNTNTGSIELYADNGTTANMTIAYTNSGGIETKNAAT